MYFYLLLVFQKMKSLKSTRTLLKNHEKRPQNSVKQLSTVRNLDFIICSKFLNGLGNIVHLK